MAIPAVISLVTLGVRDLEATTRFDTAMADAEAAGGLAVTQPAPTEWGGYNGYFADPEGNLWEVAHNPFWPLDERGLPQLP
ncbi:MAG: uncharacterized protein QOG80_3107 [Pseudonocardiales bacterium]|jgi:uncharacterized glyoxalase superfamily protein PhnB|nr:uncharacterized protein [Pseudonocardiales bacterium]